MRSQHGQRSARRDRRIHSAGATFGLNCPKLDLLRNEDFLACMNENARAGAAEFTLNEYSQRLIAAIVAAKVRDG